MIDKFAYQLIVPLPTHGDAQICIENNSLAVTLLNSLSNKKLHLTLKFLYHVSDTC